MKPLAGAFLMILGVILIGWNISNLLHGMAGLPFGIGAGACSLYVGSRWVQGKGANTPG